MMRLSELCIITILENKDKVNPFVPKILSDADTRDSILRYWYLEKPEDVFVTAMCNKHYDVAEHWYYMISCYSCESPVHIALCRLAEKHNLKGIMILMGDDDTIEWLKNHSDELLDFIHLYLLFPIARDTKHREFDEYVNLFKELMEIYLSSYIREGFYRAPYMLLSVALKSRVDMIIIDLIMDESIHRDRKCGVSLINCTMEFSDGIYLDRVLSRVGDKDKRKFCKPHQIYYLCISQVGSLFETIFKRFDTHQVDAIRKKCIPTYPGSGVCKEIHMAFPPNDKMRSLIGKSFICKIPESISDVIKEIGFHKYDDELIATYNVSMISLAYLRRNSTDKEYDELLSKGSNELMNNKICTIDEAIENSSLVGGGEILNYLIDTVYIFIFTKKDSLISYIRRRTPLFNSIINEMEMG